MSTLNFAGFSQRALEQALHNINRDKYPENYAACVAEIDRRKAAGEWTVSAPEPMPETLELRKGFPIWSRLWANAVDALILGSLGVLVERLVTGEMDLQLLSVPLYVAYFLYGAVCESEICRGQTIGYRLLGLRLVRSDGRLLSLSQSLFRSLYYYGPGWIGSLIGWAAPAKSLLNSSSFYLDTGLWVFNAMVILFHPQRRSFVDLLSDSVLIFREEMPVPPLRKWIPSTLVPSAIVAVLLMVLCSFFPTDETLVLTAEQLAVTSQIEQTMGATDVFFGTFNENGVSMPLLSITGPMAKFDVSHVDENFDKLDKILRTSPWDEKEPSIRVVMTGVESGALERKHVEIKIFHR